MSRRDKTLHELLCELFEDASGLAQHISLHHGAEITRYLPAPNVGLSKFAFAVQSTVHSHGVHNDFFEALAEARPDQIDSIVPVASQFSVAVVPCSQETPTSAQRVSPSVPAPVDHGASSQSSEESSYGYRLALRRHTTWLLVFSVVTPVGVTAIVHDRPGGEYLIIATILLVPVVVIAALIRNHIALVGGVLAGIRSLDHSSKVALLSVTTGSFAGATVGAAASHAVLSDHLDPVSQAYRGGYEDDKVAQGDTTGGSEVALSAGSVILKVTPSDAEVNVDDQPYPGSSRRVVPNLAPGKHKVLVSKGEDYVPLEQEVEVTEGSAVSLPVSLQLKEVALTLEVEPKKAKISILGEDRAIDSGKGGDTIKLVRKAKVNYEIEASADGYVTRKVPILFTGKSSQLVRIELVKDPRAKPATKTSDEAKAKTAELRISTGPGLLPARVYVDNARYRKTPTTVNVSPGQHKIKWKWDNGTSASMRVSIGDNEWKVVKGVP